MKKTVLFVLLEQYADWEAAYLSSAINLLGGDHFEVKTLSLSDEMIHSIGGFHIKPDYDISTYPSEYEAVVLVGAMTWRTEQASQVKAIVQDCCQKGKVLAAICDGVVFLSTMGLLNDVSHTGNDLEDMSQWAGKAYTGQQLFQSQQAVRDKNIVTAKITGAREFAREVLLVLQVASENEIMDWYNFHK